MHVQSHTHTHCTHTHRKRQHTHTHTVQGITPSMLCSQTSLECLCLKAEEYASVSHPVSVVLRAILEEGHRTRHAPTQTTQHTQPHPHHITHNNTHTHTHSTPRSSVTLFPPPTRLPISHPHTLPHAHTHPPTPPPPPPPPPPTPDRLVWLSLTVTGGGGWGWGGGRRVVKELGTPVGRTSLDQQHDTLPQGGISTH